MSVIVQTSSNPYGASMTAALFRLITLLALALMPFGMASAPAMNQPMPANHSMAQAGHCEGQPEEDQAPASKMDCTAMCSALPATDAPTPTPRLKLAAPRSTAIVVAYAGIEPEIATPPPRQA